MESESLVEREPPVLRLFLVLVGLGCIATIASGWLVTVNIVTPGGGGVYWGFPFPWKSISAWLGHYEGFQYDWLYFVFDSLLYTAAGYAAIFFLWSTFSSNRKAKVRECLESRRTISLLAITLVILFIGSYLYDYVYLWNYWGN